MSLTMLLKCLSSLPMPHQATKAAKVNEILRELGKGTPGNYIEVRTKSVRIVIHTDDLFDPVAEVYIKGKYVAFTPNVIATMQQNAERDYTTQWRYR